MMALVIMPAVLYAAACIAMVGWEGFKGLRETLRNDPVEAWAIGAILVGFVIQILLDVAIIVAAGSTL